MKNQSKLLSWVLASIMVVAMSACDLSDTTSAEHEGDVYARMSLKLDSALSHEERQLLISDFYKSMQYEITPAQGSYFDKVFGGTSSDAVTQFIDDRVNYVLPQSVKLESRLTYIETSQVGAMLGLPPAQASSQVYTMALNIGTALWFEALAQSPKKLGFRIGDSVVPLETSRVGIIQMGQGYTLKKNGHYAFPELARISTIVHEARHSDCTGGMSRADLERVIAGDMPVSHACGHLHEVCPEGHEYAGYYACDNEAWGAYSVEGVYAAAIAKACKNCTDEEKKVGLMMASDALSRVIPLDDMMSGKLGDPDMSSTSEIHNSELKEMFRNLYRERRANSKDLVIRLQ